MTTHTLGPWRVSDDQHPDTADESYHYICGGKGYYDDEGNSGFEICGHLPIADAVLMAAAPVMLAALRRAVLALAFAAESSPAMRDDYEAVSEAIAKATGTA